MTPYFLFNLLLIFLMKAADNMLVAGITILTRHIYLYHTVGLLALPDYLLAHAMRLLKPVKIYHFSVPA